MHVGITGFLRLTAAALLGVLLNHPVAHANWADADVGAVGVQGSATVGRNGKIRVSGEGSDIGGTADSFHYLYQQLTADGTIVVRLASLQKANPWTKAGLMLRQQLTAGSIHTSLLVTPSNGIFFQHRATAGGTTTAAVTGGAPPAWLRLSRAGTSVSAFVSSDGSRWTSVGTAVVPFTGAVYVGMAVTSHRQGRIATAAFDSVEMSSTAPAPKTGPVAAWSFDEGGGTVASDQLGASPGTISGATWTSAGKFGRALVFDGLKSTVTVNHNSALNLSDAMTLEAWVRPTTLSSWRAVLAKEHSDGAAYGLYANAATPAPAGVAGLGTGSVQAAGSTQLPMDTWSHVTVTFDGAMLRLFVNGSQVGSAAAAGTLRQSTGALRIGANGGWGEYFHGTIDNVRIYDRALGASEIQQNMSIPVDPAPPYTDSTPPTASLTAPASGGTVAGVVTVSATAADNVGVASVQFLANGSALGPADAAAPYAVSWDTTGVANGTYVLTAVARDAAGNSGTSASVTITVNNVTVPPNPRIVEFNSPDHNKLLSDGRPAVSGYTLEVWLAGATPGSSQPYRATQIGKPSSTSTLIRSDQEAFLTGLPKGQEYFTTVLATGPGGDARSSKSNPFVVY